MLFNIFCSNGDVRMKKKFELNLGKKIGQCRALIVKFGGREHIMFATCADFDVDPYEEMFFFPTDTLTLYMVTLDGELVWKKPLSKDIVPGHWYVPMYAIDMNGDGDDEIYFVDNTEKGHPLSLKGTAVGVMDPYTGETVRHLDWLPQGLQTMSHSYRRFIMGGYVHGEPVLIFGNGTYGEMRLRGLNPDYSVRFEVLIPDDGIGARGSHMSPLVDINDDGVDELLWGERCIEIDTGKELFCCDRDSYNGHSDVIQPFYDGKEWRIFTCRENRPYAKPRIITFNAKGERVWGDLDEGHIDMGWVARTKDGYICNGIRIVKKHCGADGRTHDGVEEFFYNAVTGERIDVNFPSYKTIPVDVNGDGLHEFVMGSAGGDGTLYALDGEVIAKLNGAVALISHFDEVGDGEQLFTYNEDGYVALWYDENAKDTEEAKKRYQHPFYKVNRKLTGSAANERNLAGI